MISNTTLHTAQNPAVGHQPCAPHAFTDQHVATASSSLSALWYFTLPLFDRKKAGSLAIRIFLSLVHCLVFGNAICTSVRLEAQTWLTNRQVYDFEPGDVFHYSFTHNSPPTYILRSILSRSESPTRDSLIYEVRDTLYSLGQIPRWDMEVRTQRLVYTLLDSIPRPGDQSSAIASFLIERSADSADDCGWTNSYRWSNAPDSIVIFGRKYYEETVAEGLGKSYTHTLGNNDIVYNLLSYYRKMNGCEGGRPIADPNAASVLVPVDFSATVYPNPASHTLHIHSVLHWQSYVLYDAGGRCLCSGRMSKTLDIRNLQAGMYWLELQSGKGTQRIRWQKI
jgi:hypothetical protein